MRYIGVSNFTKEHLEALLPHCKVVPHVNQVCVCVSLSVYISQLSHSCEGAFRGCGGTSSRAACESGVCIIYSSPVCVCVCACACVCACVCACACVCIDSAATS